MNHECKAIHSGICKGSVQAVSQHEPASGSSRRLKLKPTETTTLPGPRRDPQLPRSSPKQVHVPMMLPTCKLRDKKADKRSSLLFGTSSTAAASSSGASVDSDGCDPGWSAVRQQDKWKLSHNHARSDIILLKISSAAAPEGEPGSSVGFFVGLVVPSSPQRCGASRCRT